MTDMTKWLWKNVLDLCTSSCSKKNKHIIYHVKSNDELGFGFSNKPSVRTHTQFADKALFHKHRFQLYFVLASFFAMPIGPIR